MSLAKAGLHLKARLGKALFQFHPVVGRTQISAALGPVAPYFFKASKESRTLRKICCQGRSPIEHMVIMVETPHLLCHKDNIVKGVVPSIFDMFCSLEASHCSTSSQGEGITQRFEYQEAAIMGYPSVPVQHKW